MFKEFKVFFIVCIMSLAPLFTVNSHAKPPKPGPDFVWVKPHTTPDGIAIPGHWKYVGAPLEKKVWVRGHHNAERKWVPGHWKSLVPPPKKGSVWVPGHRGPKGRWIPGHWR